MAPGLLTSSYPGGAGYAAAGQHAKLGGHAQGLEDVGADAAKGEVAVRLEVVAPAAAGGNKLKGSAAASGPGASELGSGAAAISMFSEQEVHGEVEALVPLLGSLAADWQKRIGGMARLEGVALGCVAAQPSLLEPLGEALRALREPLSKQLEDRRSAVNKQVCQTLSVLARIYGNRFQDHAMHFLPVLFRVLPITIQVRDK
jgi:hypothetical protein